jgi:4'-phosphopantetheinyl transferase
MMKIFATENTEPIDKVLFQKLLLALPADRQAKINNFTKYENAQNVLFADILIRQIIQKELRIPFEAISIQRDEFDKPFLENNKDFHFNISHSGAWVVCATSRLPVGIDIEKIRPVNFGIAKRFFSKEEYNNLIGKAEDEKLSFFYELWTIKESYLKVNGKGLSIIPLELIKINFTDNEVEYTDNHNSHNYFFKQYDIDNNYKLAICAADKAFPENITRINIKTLIRN